jgi:hypothetical protein
MGVFRVESIVDGNPAFTWVRAGLEVFVARERQNKKNSAHALSRSDKVISPLRGLPAL